MFDRFDEAAMMALFFARVVAGDRDAEEMDTEDLMQGIMLAAPSAVLRFGSEQVESLAPPADDVVAQMTEERPEKDTREIPMSSHFRPVLERAVEEADALGNRAIRPEHLVLGLLREEGSKAWATLHSAGVRLQEMRLALKDEHEKSAGADATGED